MRVLLPGDPLTPREPDAAFEGETDAIRDLRLDFALLDVEALLGGDADRAVRRVPEGPLGTMVYRGWMLPVGAYETLDAAISRRGGSLVNDGEAYRRTHLFPGSYALLEGHTPRSAWVDGSPPFDPERIRRALEPFGGRPMIVKDFVKSRKHEWYDACFIPSASDGPAVDRIVQRFVELQADDLVGGLVFREFVELEAVGHHPVSGLPLGREYRLFFVDGARLIGGRYWDDVDYSDDFPAQPFDALARQIASRFFTMDIARTATGEWIVIEVGDGQVSGLPATTDPSAFYARLADAIP